MSVAIFKVPKSIIHKIQRTQDKYLYLGIIESFSQVSCSAWQALSGKNVAVSGA